MQTANRFRAWISKAIIVCRFLAGAIDLHWIANYTDQQSQTAQGTTVQYAGSIGPDLRCAVCRSSRPLLAATYSEGPWQGTVQGRLIGAARLNTAWGPLNVDDNNIPSVAYLDLRAAIAGPRTSSSMPPWTISSTRHRRLWQARQIPDAL